MSVAVTVTVDRALARLGVTVTVLPRHRHRRHGPASTRQPRRSARSPSGSRNAPATSTAAAESPIASVSGGRTPTGSGGRFRARVPTVTVNALAWRSGRPGSLAVTRMIDVPSLTAVSVTRPPQRQYRHDIGHRRRHGVRQRRRRRDPRNACDTSTVSVSCRGQFAVRQDHRVAVGGRLAPGRSRHRATARPRYV